MKIHPVEGHINRIQDCLCDKFIILRREESLYYQNWEKVFGEKEDQPEVTFSKILELFKNKEFDQLHIAYRATKLIMDTNDVGIKINDFNI